MNFAELAPYFADEEKAIRFVEKMIWPGGKPICPHCGGVDKAYRINGKNTRPGLLKCGHCRKQFTVKVGTIFESSHIPMTKWLMAIYMMCNAKKGVSANQLHRSLGISYKSAWFLCHRVREAMNKEPLKTKLSGEVEVDETYIGGKAKNNMRKKRRGPDAHKKIPVMTLIERDGKARTFRMPDQLHNKMRAVVLPNVHPSAHLITDGHPAYKGLDRYFDRHSRIDHSKEYVRGIIHINFAESYHSLLKRGIFGTFHHVSEKHLSRYLREFEFKWNSRKQSDGERTVAAIRGAKGKRLMYRTPT